MSMEHHIDVVVAKEFNRHLLIRFFEDAHGLGIQTLEVAIVGTRVENRLITADEAATIIMETINNIDNDRSVWLKKDDAFLSMGAHKIDSLRTRLFFLGFGRQWQKAYNRGLPTHESFYSIDLARYCRLILKLFEKYEIIDFSIEYN